MLPVQNIKANDNVAPEGMILKGYSSNGDPIYGHVISPNTLFHLKVDGVFRFKNQHIVTGSIETGCIHLGDSVYLIDDGHCVQSYIAGIEMLKKIGSYAEFGDSVGLLMPDDSMNWLHEGVLVTTDYDLFKAKTALQLTNDEKDYLEAFKDACENGEVSDKQRRLLEKLREMYNISEERAKELERM
jgi:hypothetical protein